MDVSAERLHHLQAAWVVVVEAKVMAHRVELVERVVPLCADVVDAMLPRVPLIEKPLDLGMAYGGMGRR